MQHPSIAVSKRQSVAPPPDVLYNASRIACEVDLAAFWTEYGFYLWLLTALGLLVLGGVILYLLRQIRRATTSYRTLTQGTDAVELGAVLEERAAQIERHESRLTQLASQLDTLAQASLQHVALIRFNPFGDVGGDQSFAAALLDGNHSGLVLSSIYSRNGVRVYAKAIQAGAAVHALSDEEEAVIAQALNQPVSTSHP